MLKNKLKKLEKTTRERKRASETGVFMVDVNYKKDRMQIDKLGFNGSVNEGEELMSKYPGAVFILMDIPRDDEDSTVYDWCK
ncbi:hypothetical protein [Ammoniphilus resinae]|uniref:Uncharacterized protein n=1 Tax=Ammoniphilus resinae TaxID=861532 RepID=A0ABS4GX95_9BACL|nr:hypothetical protein [Ammoniphilus resinae]MBP1934894.1 hypothetical protein [Ammoniphilus resinae]